MKAGTRKLKIYSKSVQRSGCKCRYIELPEIRLCGLWLQEAGFKIGQDITIDCSRNKIVIILNK